MYPRLCDHVNKAGKNQKGKCTYNQRMPLHQPSRNSGLNLFTAQDPEFRTREDGSSLLPGLLAEMASRTGWALRAGPPPSPPPCALSPQPLTQSGPASLGNRSCKASYSLGRPRRAPVDYCGRHSPNQTKGSPPPMRKAVKSHCDRAFRMGGQSCDDCFNTAMKSLRLPSIDALLPLL